MIVEEFKQLYQVLDAENVDSIEQVYDNDILFTDPFHQVHGLDALKQYFNKLYQNVESIGFEFGEVITSGDQHVIQWIMYLQHPRLTGKQPNAVAGATILKVNPEGKIISHRDYFDAGDMLYEKLPVIGKVIQWIKKQI